MAFRAFRTTVLAVTFLAVFTIISCEKEEGVSISEEEDLELERQLSIINKPAIKEIKTEHGDVYGCVDIYKQPAFDHPLLKDHKIQIPEDKKTITSKLSKFGLKEGCPQGTVPIRRMTKEGLVRIKSVSKRNVVTFRRDRPEPEFAGFQTTTSGQVYHGTGATISIYNPVVQNEEYSSALVSIESGPPEEKNSIKFGWTVNPNLYGDHNTRLFTSWTSDNHKKTGCFNTLCQGFVHFNTKIPLDHVFPQISKFDKQQYDVRLGVYQHNITKVWNLVMGDEEELIGYWPPTIFNHLASGADYIQWGGEVYSPNPKDNSPKMGSGYWNNGWYDETAYFRRVIYTDATYTPQVPKNSEVKRATSRCFLADDNSYKDDYWGYRFLFGGKGGLGRMCVG